MSQKLELPAGNAALVVGHPGHELRVYHWLERTCPHVFVLTDGSGSRSEGRIDSTTDILDRTGSRTGSIYGTFTDRRIYQLVLDGRHRDVCELADELAEQFVRNRIDYVVGDACEGYNPTHDICRLIIGAAVTMAGQRRAPVGNYDFLLTGVPGASEQGQLVTLKLSDDAFDRKVAAARGYRELRHEVDQLDRDFGLNAFRAECLRVVEPLAGFDGPPELPPYYEQYGRKQVAAGKYQSLLTYSDHIRPLSEALRTHMAAKARKAAA